VWLLFYLHEDRHPEPKHLILLTFIGGIISALAAVAAEVGLFAKPPVFAGIFYNYLPSALAVPLVVLVGVALIEEYLKYFAVKLSVLSRPEFDEPVDAMVYMVTVALGFAAIENVLFLTPVLEQSFLGGVGLTANRFFGANLLHALSSAIVGYFLARHHFSPWRKHAVAAGILIAAALHTLFNYLIIMKDSLPTPLLLLGLLLIVMAVVVFVDFERLKKAPEGSRA
jgi:RsiW-degrading membrane proteinase PrsW (M82 family)